MRDHLLVDGIASITVDNGNLIIECGIPRGTERYVLERGNREIRRIIVTSRHGPITLDVYEWIRHVGISLYIMHDGECIASSQNSHYDARLRRAQAQAVDRKIGTTITRQLLGIKMDGQAHVLRSMDRPNEAAHIDSLCKQLPRLGMTKCQSIEAEAAKFYFSQWSDVTIQFSGPGANTVSPEWLRYDTRYSPLAGQSSRTAADPINALLNYAYGVLEAETTLACHMLGLDPILGLLHRDYLGRPSMALDLMEIGRPAVDARILDFLQGRAFAKRDFVETKSGVCRLAMRTHVHEGITRQVADLVRDTLLDLYPVWESVQHALAESADQPVKARTPLTQGNRKARYTKAVA